MRLIVWTAVVAAGIAVMACGGPDKPPMVPDQPGDPTLVGDGGADMPATNPPAPATPAQPQ